MYLWIIKRPNILAFLGNITVALYVKGISAELSGKETSVTPHVENCHGYVN